MKTNSKILAVVMALVLIIGLAPIGAFAENDPPATNADTATDNIILYAGWTENTSAPKDAAQDHEKDMRASPMLRSAPPALNAPLQNGGLSAGQTVYLDLKYEGDGEVTASKYNGTVGTTVEITALPSNEYRFKNWEIVSGTGSIGAENNNLTTFTMGTTDATVKAVFETLPSTETSLAVAVEDINGVPPGTASATVDPSNPTTYTLTATPASGYQFKRWQIIQGSGGTITGEYNASTMITDCCGSVVVVAVFTTIDYVITTVANPSKGGSTECLPLWDGPACDVNLKATPNDGYVFKEWKITSGTGRITNPTEAFTVLTDITEAVTCQAEFEQIPSGQYRVSVTKNFAERGEAKANVPYGSTRTEVTLTATPASGYRFTRWEVTPENVVLADPNSATTTFRIGSEDVTVNAVFSYDASYKTTTQTDGCGRASASNNALRSGQLQQLRATPESGWSFDHWEVVSGGVTIDNENARSAFFVMRDQDVVVRAVFVPEQTNPLTEIKVTNPPDKITYTAGDIFEPDGMVVTAYYQEGSADVSGYTYSPTGMLAETDNNITISYTVNGVTKETTQAITVAPATLYAIVYHLDYGTNHPSNPAVYNKFDTITLANPTRDGHTFGGWYDNASFIGSPVTEIPAGSSGDKQFFAKWTADTYNISYQNLKGASNSNPVTYTITDTPIPLVSPTGATGYTFDGWYDNATFSGSPVTGITANSTGDRTFYAKWTEITVTGITLNSDSANKIYTEGDALDVTGLTLEVSKSDGSKETVNVTAAMVTGFDSSKLGTQTLTVSYEGFTATYEIEVKAKTTPPSPTYEATIQSVTWQKGSGKNLDLTFKRSEDDHLTYGLFGSLEIGGVTVGSANYSAAEGSLKLSIKPEYLETLSVGDHTVKVNFQDGSATVKLTVKAAATQPTPSPKPSEPASPKTGDESNPALHGSLMFLSVAAMMVLLLYARKRKIEK